MAAPDTDGVLRGLAERLLTLRVTVVLSRDLDGHAAHLDAAAIRTKLHDAWSGYLERGEPVVAEDRVKVLAKVDAPAARAPVTGAHFDALAKRARAVHARLGAPTEADKGGRTGGEALHPAVVQRIASLCEALADPPSDDVGRVSYQLLLGKALALGTDPVLLETVITLDGDVTTRIDQAWLDHGDGPDGQRVQTVLALQRMGMQAAMSWWSGLVELVGKAGSALVKLVLKS